MEELWRQCVCWLVETGVLPNRHKTTFPYAQIFDLAQTLRDGVVLCNLLNAIHPGAVDLSRINIRPQMLQFLCLQNLRTVIHSLETVFGLSQRELFEPIELYELTNFRQVLESLSALSYLPISAQKFRPFPSGLSTQHNFYKRTEDEEDEDIYAPLADLASERELIDEEEDLYDTVSEVEEDSIYGSIIDVKPAKAPPKDKRSFCINEIVETERNYVNHLEMIQTKFIQPMRQLFSDSDIRAIFSNIEKFLPVHQEFLRDIENAVEDNSKNMSKPFLKVKDNLLQYGVYCSNLPDALTHLLDLLQDEPSKIKIENLQNVATPNKFKLRELLFVSMQRILKYHLLVKELAKQTNESHLDKKNLENALEAMQEVAQFINEVKRDSEMLQTINKVQSCLVDYQMSTPLSSYGRLLKDGQLKIKTSKTKAQLRFTYLFDQALFVTNPKNEVYKLTDLIRLEEFFLDDTNQSKGKWGWTWNLRDKFQTQIYSFYAKTENEKLKWIENINIAFDIIRPEKLKGKSHLFKIKTFKDPTYCCHCNKLLQGCFFQGYQCERTNKQCHKDCLLEAWKSIGNEAPPVIERPLASSKPASTNHLPLPSPGSPKNTTGTMGELYKAHREYNSVPFPPIPGCSAISFSTGEQVEVLNKDNDFWWMGRTMSNYSKTGYFPSAYVSPLGGGGAKTTRTRYEPSTPFSPISLNSISPGFPPPSRLEDFDWYAGNIERENAKGFLIDKPTGTFLVRINKEKGLAISLKFKSEIKHIKVFKQFGMYYIAEGNSFPSVPALIEFYQRNKLSCSFFGLETYLTASYRARRPSNSNSVGSSPTLSSPKAVPFHQPQMPFSPIHNTISPNGQYPNHHPLSHPSKIIEINGQEYEIMSKGKVLYDFEPQSPQELGLRCGQVVNIISKPNGDDGWWKGELFHRVGYFPAKFVQEMRI